MAKQSVRSSTSDGDGNSVRNRILLSLGSKECQEALSKLEFVRLQLHQVIHEAGETIKSGYFLNNGLASVLSVQPDGKSVGGWTHWQRRFCRLGTAGRIPKQPGQSSCPG